MRRAVVVAVAALALMLAACSCSSESRGGSTATAQPSGSATTAPLAADPIANLTLAQRVGQLFMVGTPATSVDPVTIDAISNLHVGNLFLAGRSHLGVSATAAIVKAFTSRVNIPSTDGEPLLVATDQEGGEVQVLHGAGFQQMPTGVQQSGMSPAALTSGASGWGSELAAAGVNMNLAPVVDLLPAPSFAPDNPPIGVFDRELGFTPSEIVAHANAFRAGMADAHVVTVLKHFPGLGHVTENTDTSRNVTDTSVAQGGPDLSIYRSEIAAGATCVMVSSAVYSKLDPAEPAVFSSKVVTGLLRNSLGFRGVIITDDLSAPAQVQYLPLGARAIDAISAGVDIVLVSASPEDTAAMVQAVLAKAETNPAFALVVANAARRVIELKQAELPVPPAAGAPQKNPTWPAGAVLN